MTFKIWFASISVVCSHDFSFWVLLIFQKMRVVLRILFLRSSISSSNWLSKFCCLLYLSLWSLNQNFKCSGSSWWLSELFDLFFPMQSVGHYDSHPFCLEGCRFFCSVLQTLCQWELWFHLPLRCLVVLDPWSVAVLVLTEWW